MSVLFASISDASVTVIVAGLVQVVGLVIGFLTLWVKLQHGVAKADEAATKAAAVEKKIDRNTTITTETKDATVAMAGNIDRKLNGGLDVAIADAVKPIQKEFETHKTEVNGKLNTLTEYVHQRNHDILNAISVQSNKLNVLLEKAGIDTTQGLK